jgi:hypothetical protein
MENPPEGKKLRSLTEAEVQRIADEHALSAYPFRWKAKLHLELDDPPVSYFGPTPSADMEGSLFGVGRFVVNRVTGKVRDFHSAKLIRASQAASLAEGTHDLAVVVRYLVTYSVHDLHELAGYKTPSTEV